MFLFYSRVRGCGNNLNGDIAGSYETDCENNPMTVKVSSYLKWITYATLDIINPLGNLVLKNNQITP